MNVFITKNRGITKTFLEENIDVLVRVYEEMRMDGFDGIDYYEDYLNSIENIKLHSSDIDDIVMYFNFIN